jgi:cell division protein FtsB
MDKSNHSDEDITKQRYRGPSILSAMAGEGVIAHFILGFFGLMSGAAAGFFAPKEMNAVEQSFSKFHTQGMKSSNWLIKPFAFGAKLLQQGADMLTTHIPKKEILEARLGEGKLKAMVFGGGLLGAIGYFIFPLVLGPKGARKGIAGKKQVKDLQSALIKEREESNDLRKKVIDKETEIETLKNTPAERKEKHHSAGSDTPHHKIHAPIHEASLTAAADQISL